MRFDAYIPCRALQPYIKKFVIAEQAGSQPYKVLPGASLVAGFQYRGRLDILKDGKPEILASTGITGLMNQYRIFSNSADIGTVLVYFTETGASHFFKFPLNELFAESVSLNAFIPDLLLSNISEKLASAETDHKRIVVIEEFLMSQLDYSTEDKLVTEAIRLIKASYGTIRITELAEKLYTSQSPLEKRFRKIVGATPKKFASIIRLQNLIANAGNSRSMTELGYVAGYYDQAHFIKDFRKFTGETPETFFSGEIK